MLLTIFLVNQQSKVARLAVAYTRGAAEIRFESLRFDGPVSAGEGWLSLDEQQSEGTIDSPIRAGESWPSLDQLVDESEGTIKQDVQFLMDFAIIGHPKTATTYTLKWLHAHDDVQVYTEELHALQTGKLTEHVALLYNLSTGMNYKRGYKAPRDVRNPYALRAFAEYWPETKLIVGLRHPVLWFQSFYNFRVREGRAMPPAETLLGECSPETFSVCTNGALFHVNLSLLGKTNLTAQEQELLSTPRDTMLFENLPRLPNPVFLYEVTQIYDDDPARVEQYRIDLSDYLGLREPLSPSSHDRPASTKYNAINICDSKYALIREELMKHSRAASLWIRKYLLDHPDVTVSSRDRFEELLEGWMEDPCE